MQSDFSITLINFSLLLMILYEFAKLRIYAPYSSLMWALRTYAPYLSLIRDLSGFSLINRHLLLLQLKGKVCFVSALQLTIHPCLFLSFSLSSLSFYHIKLFYMFFFLYFILSNWLHHYLYKLFCNIFTFFVLFFF